MIRDANQRLIKVENHCCTPIVSWKSGYNMFIIIIKPTVDAVKKIWIWSCLLCLQALYFTALVAVEAGLFDCPNEVPKYADWFNLFMFNSEFSQWITDNGGWVRTTLQHKTEQLQKQTTFYNITQNHWELSIIEKTALCACGVCWQSVFKDLARACNMRKYI